MRHFLHTLTLLLLALPIRAQELDPLLPWQLGKSCGEVCLEMCGDSDEFCSLFSSGSSIFLKTDGGDTVTSSTSGDFEEMTDGSTDGGRSGHLKTRTATGTAITVVETAVGGGTAMLPSISKKLAQKIRLQKWLKKIDLPDGIDTKTFTKALDNLEDGGEAFLKDFEEASGEVVERLVKKPELVDARTRLRKIGVNEKIFKDVDALEAWTKLESVSVSKVAPTVMEPLKIVGLTDDEIGKLITINRKASVGNATKAEIKLSQEIAEVCFDLPKKGDRITKYISVEDFENHHINGVKKEKGRSVIGGFIAKESDYARYNTNVSSNQLIVDFGLTYEGSPFSANKGYVKIETVMTDKMAVKQPHLVNDAQTKYSQPQTFTGSLGHPEVEKITPEFYLEGERKPIDVGSTAIEFDANGKEV